VAIDCDHPRPRLNLPGYVPRRMAWQVPQYIPDLPPSAARVIREALQGIYQELGRQGQVRNQMPLEGDMYAQPGSVITGVADGQTVTLLPPGALGYTDPVSLLITDVASPMNVVAPDGTITQIGAPGLYDFAPASSTEYQTSPGGAVVAGSVPTDTLLGRDSPGTGAVEFIALTAPLELDGAGNLRIAAAGITAVHLAASVAGDGLTGGAGAALAVGAGDGIDVDANSVAVDVTDIIDNVTITEVATNNIQRAALTGFAVATAGSNATTSAEPIVTFGASANMSNERVLSNGTGTTVDIGTAGQIQIDIDTPLTDGDKGDITVATNGTVWTVDNDAVSNAKLANMASPRLKGRTTASTGDPEDLTLTNSTSITWNTSTGGAISTERAAVSGSVTLAQNANLAQFSGMAANTTLLPTRTYYNWIAGTNTTVTGTSNATDLLMSVNVDDFPLSGLADQAANTIVANATGSSAAPTAVAVSADSLLARVGGNLTSHAFSTLAGGGIAYAAGVMAVGAGTGITVNANDVAVTIPLTDGDKGDITVATNGTVWTVDADAITNTKLANMAADTIKANVTGSSADPTDHSLSTLAGGGLTYTSTAGIIAVGAGTGITVAANDVSVTTPLTDGDKGDITVSTNGTVWTIDNAAVTLAKLANLAAGTAIGRQIDAGTGVPVALTGREIGELARFDFFESFSLAAGVQTLTLDARTCIAFITPSAAHDVIIDQIAHGSSNTGARVLIVKQGASGRVILRDGNVGANNIWTPGSVDFVLPLFNDGVLVTHSGSRWYLDSRKLALNDQDYGDITVSNSGQTWTIDNAAVTLAKMENRTAGTVIGRAIDAGTGVPTALTGAEVGSLARRYWWETTDTTSSGTINGYALTDKQVQIHFNLALAATIRSFTVQTGKTLEIALESTSAALTLVNENAGGTLGLIRTPGGVDLVLTGGDACVLTYLNNRWRVVAVSRGAALTDGDKGDITVSSSGATWTIDNDVVSDAKLRNSAALSVIGRSANSTGDPADIAAANDGEVLRRSGTTLGFGTIATAGITDAAVTLAKMANLAQSTIIGRAEGGGTGVPQALTPTQVVAIVDGESPTWTGAHTFNGTALTANVTTADILLGAAVGGVGLFSGQATQNVTNGDLVLNSASGIAINATGTAVTSVGDGVVDINATTLDADVTSFLIDATNSSSIAVGGTGDLTLAAGGAVIVASPLEAAALEGTGPAVFSDTVEMNDSTFLDQTFSLRGGQNSATATLNNVALGAVSVLRLSATNFLLSGMAPSVAGGQVVLIFNVNETEDATILVESTNSTLGNRFAGETTSRKVRAGEGVLAWYDGTSEKWRLVGSLLDLAS
jgi:hypothetical protein